jgi:antitoxin HicB
MSLVNSWEAKEKAATAVCTSVMNLPLFKIERRRLAGSFWLRCVVTFRSIPMSYERCAAMFTFAYPAKFNAGRDGRILVEFVDLPRVATDGKDRREAFEEAMDALGSDLSIRLSRREEIPVPSRAKRGYRMVPVPLWLAPKLALYVAMRDQRVNNSELARRLGVHERVVRRMMDPQHSTKAEKDPGGAGGFG